MRHQQTIDTPTTAVDIRFLIEQGRQVVAFARASYERHGRGIVVVDRQSADPVKIAYVRYIDVVDLGAGVVIEGLMRAMRDYDPTCEFVCLFVYDDMHAHAYRYRLPDGAVTQEFFFGPPIA